MTRQWDLFSAAMVAEQADGYEPETEQEWLDAFQFLIDAGVVNSLQGYFGRTARDLINEGYCKPPPT